jgi:hypothetical protein
MPNPELLLVGANNPPRGRLSVRRRRARNLPLTVWYKGRRWTFIQLRQKYGGKKALRIWNAHHTRFHGRKRLRLMTYSKPLRKRRRKVGRKSRRRVSKRRRKVGKRRRKVSKRRKGGRRRKSARRRRKGGKRRKFVFTKARRRALAKARRKSRKGRRRKGGKRRKR